MAVVVVVVSWDSALEKVPRRKELGRQFHRPACQIVPLNVCNDLAKPMKALEGKNSLQIVFSSKLSSLPQFLPIDPHFVRKGCSKICTKRCQFSHRDCQKYCACQANQTRRGDSKVSAKQRAFCKTGKRHLHPLLQLRFSTMRTWSKTTPQWCVKTRLKCCQVTSCSIFHGFCGVFVFFFICLCHVISCLFF